MFYYYINPRTGKNAMVKDFNDSVAERLLEDKENDYLLAISGYSNTIKVIVWHSCRWGGDHEDCPETIAEIKLNKALAKGIIKNNSLSMFKHTHTDKELSRVVNMFQL